MALCGTLHVPVWSMSVQGAVHTTLKSIAGVCSGWHSCGEPGPRVMQEFAGGM